MQELHTKYLFSTMCFVHAHAKLACASSCMLTPASISCINILSQNLYISVLSLYTFQHDALRMGVACVRAFGLQVNATGINHLQRTAATVTTLTMILTPVTSPLHTFQGRNKRQPYSRLPYAAYSDTVYQFTPNSSCTITHTAAQCWTPHCQSQVLSPHLLQ